MNGINAYALLIGASILVILSAVFNMISKKTKLPTVLLLIGTGYAFREIAISYGWDEILTFISSLEVLGIVGVILIVLEAALELKLTKEKSWLIVKSFGTALILLVITSATVAFILSQAFLIEFQISLIYAIPISVMSSSIIIPSVVQLDENKKEFMIYESTFSDILGIIFFYAILDMIKSPGSGIVAVYTLSNTVITIIVAAIITYILIFVFQKVFKHINYFLVFAILMLLYATGKMFHLSSLVLVLIFGLIVNNRQLFFRGRISKIINNERYDNVLVNFKDFTAQTAFLVRTFFFFIFGMSITFSSVGDIKVIVITLMILLTLYLTRFLNLSLFFKSKKIFTELFIAPRGLISILLILSIPKEVTVQYFNSDILSLIIIITNVIMMFALLFDKSEVESVFEFDDFYDDSFNK